MYHSSNVLWYITKTTQEELRGKALRSAFLYHFSSLTFSGFFLSQHGERKWKRENGNFQGWELIVRVWGQCERSHVVIARAMIFCALFMLSHGNLKLRQVGFGCCWWKFSLDFPFALFSLSISGSLLLFYFCEMRAYFGTFWKELLRKSLFALISLWFDLRHFLSLSRSLSGGNCDRRTHPSNCGCCHNWLFN